MKRGPGPSRLHPPGRPRWGAWLGLAVVLAFAGLVVWLMLWVAAW